MSLRSVGPISRILDKQPRVKLSSGFSSVKRLLRLEQHLNVDIAIWIKRDDMLRPLFGNKLRYLEFLLGYYELSGCDCLVHGGGATSNYLAQLAMIGAERGIDIHLAISGPRTQVLQANPSIEALCGASLHFSNADPRREGNMASKKAIAEKLTVMGRKPFVIDYPLSNYTAYLGYMDCMREIVLQANEFDCTFTHVVLCSGWHSYLGLRIGADLVWPDLHVTGFRPAARSSTWLGREYPQFDVFLCEKVTEFARFLGEPLEPSAFDLSEEAVGPGYAYVDDRTVHAMKLMASTEGILLDPIYTGKAFAGLLGRLSESFYPRGSSVLFVHTGGITNLFGYGAELSRYLLDSEG